MIFLISMLAWEDNHFESWLEIMLIFAKLIEHGTRRLARESNLFELDKLLVLVLGVAVTCSQKGKCIK